MNNPYQREKNYLQIYSETCSTKIRKGIEKREKIRKKALTKKLENVLLAFGIIVCAYLFFQPVHNPIKYKWIEVKVESGDTMYSLQEKYAPNSNIKVLLFEDNLKNSNMEKLVPGQYVYVIAEKDLY